MDVKEFKKIVAEHTGFDSANEVSLDFTFADDLLLDDDVYYGLLEDLEEEFNVDIISHDGEFESLRDLTCVIKKGV